MSINSKMSAIAGEIRTLSGKTSPLGLDAMANTLNTENTNFESNLNTQDNLIACILEALEGKGTGIDVDISMIDKIITRTVTHYENGTAEIIGDYAFMGCPNLTSVNFANCVTIGIKAFFGCTNLSSISFPNCVQIGEHAFATCSNLTSVNLPVCTDIGVGALEYCDALTTVNLPKCKNLSGYAIQKCTNLTSVNLPECVQIGECAFYDCPNLTSIYLGAPTFCVLASKNALFNTGIDPASGAIYVPASLVDTYKADAQWSYYSSRIRAIET